MKNVLRNRLVLLMAVVLECTGLNARGYADYGNTQYKIVYGAHRKKYALSRPFGVDQKEQLPMEERGTGYEMRHPQGTEYYYRYLQNNPEPHYLHSGMSGEGEPEPIDLTETEEV